MSDPTRPDIPAGPLTLPQDEFEMVRWVFEMTGGPAFPANAATACRIAARMNAGGNGEVFRRLAEAIGGATAPGSPETPREAPSSLGAGQASVTADGQPREQPGPDLREALGRVAHNAYREWLTEQPRPDGWAPALSPAWDDITPGLREACMRIGHAVACYALTENAVTWGTDCTSCARTLDRAYAETVRREKAEARLAALRSLCDEGAPAVAVDRIEAVIGGEEADRG